MNRARRTCLVAAAGFVLAPRLRAQTNWRDVAVPFYGPDAVLQGLMRHHLLPRCDDFVTAADALAAALRDADPERRRAAWRRAMAAWEALNAVAVGPLLSRRSARAIDFQPTRPRLIEKALKAGPPWNLELVGTPAKGLPAIEWMLWTAAPDPRHAAYLAALGAEIAAEAAALRRETAALAAHEWGEDDGPDAVAEFVNQWVGGLEQLRWASMEKPLRAGRPDEWPRAASGATAEAWAARWRTLRTLTVFGGGSAPVPGDGVVPVETWLRGRGLNAEADALRAAGLRADQAMTGLTPAGDVAGAAAALQVLQRLVEERIAPALDVRLGFSSADGD